MSNLARAVELAQALAENNENGEALLALLLDMQDREQNIDYSEDDLDYEDPEVEAANSRAYKYGGDYWQNDAGEWCCG